MLLAKNVVKRDILFQFARLRARVYADYWLRCRTLYTLKHMYWSVYGILPWSLNGSKALALSHAGYSKTKKLYKIISTPPCFFFRTKNHETLMFNHNCNHSTKNKTNHPISSNSHPSATANKASKGGLKIKQEHHII